MTIFEEAEQIVSGPRRESYGPVDESFSRLASIWTGILNTPVSPFHVALCMIGLKLHREANAHHHDNLVDIAGYTKLLADLHDGNQSDNPQNP